MNGEQLLVANNTSSPVDKICRKVLLKVFSMLPSGHLIIKENGALVEAFGSKHSDIQAEINILDMSVYRRLLFGGSIASGETYVEGLWETPDLTQVIQVFARNLPVLDQWESKLEWLAMPMRQLMHLKRQNTAKQAKKNISAHYDLGNQLYQEFLDESMMYSAAIYPSQNASLAEAQQHKLRTICEKLKLSENDHLLEIGTGWGSLAVYAAKHYGCKVTTTTISEEQFNYAQQQIIDNNLEDKITLLKDDYRDLTGQFDKLVSIEMIEAVGKKFLPTFFEQCNSLLKPNGLMLLQSITIADQRYDSYSKGVDFIQKHIFPGGFLPSQLVLNQHVKTFTNMMIGDLQDIGLDYARTLKDWHNNFNAKYNKLSELGYDERFRNLWQYYLSYCEGGFLERTISTVQLVLFKPEYRNALSRG
ncbi:class I SAM-dependent methyltransferase [Alteromonadaceae bacterium M269]|nr:class I SAM-dependent methyltransferase [Alteromonadaceae bacterium M269]